jgi:uncharacterized protein YozE (UPF0346 family)
MSKRLLFYSYLLRQKARDDRIGALAQYAIHCPAWPRQARELRHVRAYLQSERASPENLAVLESAWLEYKGVTAPTVSEAQK